MISIDDFKQIFKDTDFDQDELRKFYRSIKKSVIFKHMGRPAWPQLIKLEESCQWPVLRKIDDPGLSIYRGADRELRDEFLKSISDEKEVRRRKSCPGKIPFWTRLQSIVNQRIELFTHIFSFSKDDERHCERVAMRYGDIMDRKTRSRKKILTIGIGAGAATLAGAAIWYLSKHEKK